MPPKGKGKKQQSNAKAGAAGKKQTTCAQADSVEDGDIVLADAAMGSMQFHRGVTKMRNLLKYRASDRCAKAYIYIYIDLDMQPLRETYWWTVYKHMKASKQEKEEAARALAKYDILTDHCDRQRFLKNFE